MSLGRAVRPSEAGGSVVARAAVARPGSMPITAAIVALPGLGTTSPDRSPLFCRYLTEPGLARISRKWCGVTGRRAGRISERRDWWRSPRNLAQLTRPAGNVKMVRSKDASRVLSRGIPFLQHLRSIVSGPMLSLRVTAPQLRAPRASTQRT